MVVKTLAVLALRHYRDPLSWAGIITAVGTAAHLAIPPEYYAPLEAICAAVVSLLLLKADGRANPHVDPATGAIPERVQVEPPAAPRVPTDAGPHVSPDGGALVRQPDDPGPKPVRPGFGDHIP